MTSPIPLAENGSVGFLRTLPRRGAPRRHEPLTPLAMPTAEQPVRIEILFQYVQRLDIPMSFEGLAMEDATLEDGERFPWSADLVSFPECQGIPDAIGREVGRSSGGNGLCLRGGRSSSGCRINVSHDGVINSAGGGISLLSAADSSTRSVASRR